jgi:hypothetical protein
MHSALWLLMRLQTRAALRRVTRKVRTPKGAFFVIVGALVFLLWLGPVLFSVKLGPTTNPETVRSIAPLLLLVMCILTLIGGGGDKSISFTQGEINFLFPGPFTRRELLLYKLTRTLIGALLSGLVFSIALLQHASTRLAAFIGGVLAMGFVQLLTLVFSLLAQSIGTRAYTLARKIILFGVFAALVVPMASSGREAFRNGFLEGAKAVGQSTAGKVVLAPMVPFVRTFAAQSPSELATWGMTSLAINAGLLVLLLRLDADYREASLAASQRIFDRLERMRRGQIVANTSSAGAKRRRLPMFPWLGGAGPTAWRQFTTALRTSRGTLFFLLIMSCSVAPAFLAAKGNAAIPIATASLWMTVILSMMLKFDFRGELEQMDWMKTLPISPTAMAAGQLAAPVVVLTIVQTILMLSAAYIAPPHHRIMLLAASPFLFPFNLLMTGMDNLLFLLYPTRTAGMSPGDVGMMGRTIVFFILKIIGVMTVCGIAFTLGAIAYFVSGRSMSAGGIGAFIALCAMSLAIVPCVGSAFRKFDPSFDTPA